MQYVQLVRICFLASEEMLFENVDDDGQTEDGYLAIP